VPYVLVSNVPWGEPHYGEMTPVGKAQPTVGYCGCNEKVLVDCEAEFDESLNWT
jgi:hypothetical protein